MIEPFTFSVRGTPRPQPRPRFVRGRVVSTADPKAKLWRAAVERAAREAVENSGRAVPLFRGAVRLRCEFTMPAMGKPERYGEPHTLKPDASNLLKLIEDVMENVGVFANDSQIVIASPRKWWGAHPGVAVVIESAEEDRAEPMAAVEGNPPAWLQGGDGFGS